MGKVYLVGAGPGAPDLLTLRAARLLEAAGIVFHDALVHRDTLALAKQARLVDVGKRNGRVSTEQRFTNRALVEAEVVPGITAALAASASLGLSLTRRGLSRHVAFVTPRSGAGQPP